MLISRTLPLSGPCVATWFGRAGKQYNFAVVPLEVLYLDQPAVYVLAKRNGGGTTALFVGHTERAHPRLAGPGSLFPHAWNRAMALGMTEVHVRFEACSPRLQAAEVDDLVASLAPPLNADAETHAGARPFPRDERELPGAAAENVAPTQAAQVISGAIAREVRSPRPNSPRLETSTLPLSFVGVFRVLRAWLERSVRTTRVRLFRAAELGTPDAELASESDGKAVRLPDRAEPEMPKRAEAVEAVSSTRAEAPAVEAEVLEPPGPSTVTRMELDSGNSQDQPTERAPTVLFAGELSYVWGADLLVDAAITVCQTDHRPQFVFAGDGPLRGELEARMWQAGCAHRCRFLGDVGSEAFEDVLEDCCFVVIPARGLQSDQLARQATDFGKPVLVTHQSGITCIAHGMTGLVTYDNPGSLVWGIRELLAKPMQIATRAMPLEGAPVSHSLAA